jgi:hypothetical protein
MIRSVRGGVFISSRPADTRLDNALPVLLIFMLLGSPLVWEHHPVFLALAYLIILKRLDRPWEWSLYGLAYFLEYLLPTFDFFPWSFGRLLSPLILLVLIYVASGRSEYGSL